MQCEIVPIAESHIEGFYAALDAVVRERKYLGFLTSPPIEGTRAFVLDNIRNDHAQFVALSSGRVVGWCDVLPAGDDKTTRAHIGTLGIGLLPEFRGRGLGKSLMEATIAKARAKGLTRIELTVYAGNDRAIRLYRQLGFAEEGVKKNGALIDGKYIDVHAMALLF